MGLQARPARRLSQKDRKKARPKKSPGDQYDQRQYKQAIYRACDRAKVDRWSPHQLRHAAITIAVDAMGNARGAQELANHRDARTTGGYTAKTYKNAFAAAVVLAKETANFPLA